ncbi:hypothetical protein C1H46_004599 [Malus baccata]|uniref:Uncharacterized protein n=1 Tax=Malus baccata TaxID=106549 RepID=A0A540NFK3_MALBA|nr:hypothetical protein C1H46_004599 [Malus baccata]
MEATGHVNEEPYEASLDNYGCCDGPKSGRLRATNNDPKLFIPIYKVLGQFRGII